VVDSARGLLLVNRSPATEATEIQCSARSQVVQNPTWPRVCGPRV